MTVGIALKNKTSKYEKLQNLAFKKDKSGALLVTQSKVMYLILIKCYGNRDSVV